MTREEEERAAHRSLILKRVEVLVTLLVCVLGLFLVWGVWDGPPVAAPFTRVGGASRVETALEAARFWLTPPRSVVETQTRSSKVMLGAAQCAVAHDAPLLFTSPNPKQRRQVQALIKDWSQVAKSNGVPAPRRIVIGKHHMMSSCRPKNDISGLSTLKAPDPLIQFRDVQSEQTLAQFVVFAAAIEPGHPPDVAVGLALAAHIASANREPVSLVVVPHYLESDHELEGKLKSQHEAVTGGVVLGQTPTVPEETRALLRQLLTARDGHGLLAQLQGELGSVGTLIGALLALGGAAAATRIAVLLLEQPGGLGLGTIAHFLATSVRQTPISIREVGKRTRKVSKRIKGLIMPEKRSDWLDGLGENKEVTVWLRSGRRVTGIIESQIPPKTRDATVFRIRKAPLAPSGGPPSPPRPDGNYVLVWVKDIEQIDYNDSK